MILKKNEENFEPKEEAIIEVSQIIDEINYTLKIYFSKDKQSIIFKIEQENIQPHYYYEKFYLIDFKRDYKRYSLMNNLSEIFQDIQLIINKFSTKIENDPSNKVKITIHNNSDILAVFTLRKKIRSQNRLNVVLMDQIQENKNKVKSIKKQSTKLEKNMKSQNDLINDINNKIDTINENLDNIIKEINDIKDDIKSKNNNFKENKRNKIAKKIKEEEKSKNNDIKDIKERKEEEEIIQNKKKKICKKETFYEIVFILNIFIIILIAYLFFKMKSLEQKEQFEKKKVNKMKKKYSFVNIFESLSEEDIKFIQHAFETGEITKNSDDDDDEEEDDDKNKNDIKIDIKDNKGENIEKDLKDDKAGNKKQKESVKKEKD